MKIHGFILLFLALIISGACTPSQAITQEPQVLPLVTSEEVVPTQQTPSTLPLFSPTQRDNSQMSPSAPGLQSLIEKAKEDLARRLSIPEVEISVAEAAEVTWPDTKQMVEFPPGPLSVGDEPVRRIKEIKFSTGILRVISPTDCVKDRLAAYYWKSMLHLRGCLFSNKL